MSVAAATVPAYVWGCNRSSSQRSPLRHFCLLAIAAVLGVSCMLAAAFPALADDGQQPGQATAAARLAADSTASADTPPSPTSSSSPQTTAGTAKPDGPAAPAADNGLLRFISDPRAWVADVFLAALVALLQGIGDLARQAVGSVMASPLNFVTQTPPAVSYASPTVRTLWSVVRAVANGGLVLVAVWGGVSLIVRGQLGAAYHEIKELLPRLAIAALLINSSLWWGQFFIDLENELCLALGQASLPAWERATTSAQVLANVLAAVVYLLAGLLLLIQMLMRLALVDVLLVTAPLAFLCWVLPETEGWTRTWTSSFGTAVFAQFVQVVALKLGVSLMTDLTPLAEDTSLVSVLVGIALLALTLKIPGLLRGQLGDGMGFVRYYGYQRAAQALNGSGGRPGTGAKSRAA